MEFLAGRGARRVLVLGMGGGGDVTSAAMLAYAMRRSGLWVSLASIAWERYVHDPCPGPIRLSEVVNAVWRGDHAILINERSKAIRGGREVLFEAVRVSKALNEPIYVIDIAGGFHGYRRGLNEVLDATGADVVIGVDVGGDVLALGHEEDLWSPLADWLGLAVVSETRDGLIAVHSPGSDGELGQEYVLSRVDRLAARGGLVGVRCMSREDAELLDTLRTHVKSEASIIALLAFRGLRGEVAIRGGSRTVKVNFLSTLTFFLEAAVVAEEAKPLAQLKRTSSIEEANDVLNAFGIYTELDLERDLAAMGVEPGRVDGKLLLRVREHGMRRVGRSQEQK